MLPRRGDGEGVPVYSGKKDEHATELSRVFHRITGRESVTQELRPSGFGNLVGVSSQVQQIHLGDRVAGDGRPDPEASYEPLPPVRPRPGRTKVQAISSTPDQSSRTDTRNLSSGYVPRESHSSLFWSKKYGSMTNIKSTPETSPIPRGNGIHTDTRPSNIARGSEGLPTISKIKESFETEGHRGSQLSYQQIHMGDRVSGDGRQNLEIHDKPPPPKPPPKPAWTNTQILERSTSHENSRTEMRSESYGHVPRQGERHSSLVGPRKYGSMTNIKSAVETLPTLGAHGIPFDIRPTQEPSNMARGYESQSSVTSAIESFETEGHRGSQLSYQQIHMGDRVSGDGRQNQEIHDKPPPPQPPPKPARTNFQIWEHSISYESSRPEMQSMNHRQGESHSSLLASRKYRSMTDINSAPETLPTLGAHGIHVDTRSTLKPPHMVREHESQSSVTSATERRPRNKRHSYAMATLAEEDNSQFGPSLYQVAVHSMGLYENCGKKGLDTLESSKHHHNQPLRTESECMSKLNKMIKRRDFGSMPCIISAPDTPLEPPGDHSDSDDSTFTSTDCSFWTDWTSDTEEPLYDGGLSDETSDTPSSTPLLSPSEMGGDNQMITKEILQGERSYVDSLKRIIKILKPSRSKSIASIICASLKEICNSHKLLHMKLKKSERDEEKIGDIITASFSEPKLLKAYSTYVNKIDDAKAEMKRRRKQSADRNFTDDLVKPVQRIAQLKTCLEEMMMTTVMMKMRRHQWNDNS